MDTPIEIRYDGTTAVEWIIDIFQTEQEALKKLIELAKTGNPYENGSWSWEDDESVKELERLILEEN